MDDSGACIYRVDTDGSGKTADSMASLLPSMNQETGSLFEDGTYVVYERLEPYGWTVAVQAAQDRVLDMESTIRYTAVFIGAVFLAFLCLYSYFPERIHRPIGVVWRAGWLSSGRAAGNPGSISTTLFLCISPGMLYNGKNNKQTINKQQVKRIGRKNSMEIRILELIEGAKKAEGLTVIIDVFRAFSLECYLYARGASAVFPAGSVEEARHMKQVHPEYLLIGERRGRRCEGFDYGNSPSQTRNADLSGKKIVHTTSAGTQGIVNAVHAEEILTGSLVNARAVADYISRRQPETVSLVAMGNGGERTAREDVICARYIKCLLEGRPCLIDEEIRSLKTAGGEHFFQSPYPGNLSSGGFLALHKA